MARSHVKAQATKRLSYTHSHIGTHKHTRAPLCLSLYRYASLCIHLPLYISLDVDGHTQMHWFGRDKKEEEEERRIGIDDG